MTFARLNVELISANTMGTPGVRGATLMLLSQVGGPTSVFARRDHQGSGPLS